MNNKILKKHKIDERFVLSERKFLYTFGYLCLEDDLILNETMTKKQLYYFLEQKLEPAFEDEVDLESVSTGRIILVGRGNNFRAYHRPALISLEKNNVSTKKINRPQRIESYSEVNSKFSDMNLSQLIQVYYENDEKEESIVYLEEILSRVSVKDVRETKTIARKEKNKIKCYKKRIGCNIDK